MIAVDISMTSIRMRYELQQMLCCAALLCWTAGLLDWTALVMRGEGVQICRFGRARHRPFLYYFD